MLLSGQDYLKNLGPYKPMYFLFGIPLSESKFQLSFKYRLFTSAAPVALRHPWATGIHVGYTQASFWDLRSDSKPFEDTSYMPEAFYVSRNLAWRPRAVDGLFLHAGVQHESNGRGGDASRSINMVYLSPIFAFRFPNTRLDVGIAPRIKLYFDDSENPDLEDYRGHADVALAFGSAHGPVLKANLRAARRGTSVEIDATYPLSRSWVESAQIYLHAQYTNTLAERLLDYSERREAFRIGLSFFR